MRVQLSRSMDLRFLRKCWVSIQNPAHQYVAAEVLNQKALVMEKLGRWNETKQLRIAIGEILKDYSDRVPVANNLHNLGQLCINLGQYDEAVSLLEKSRVLHREAGSRTGEWKTLGTIGELYLQSGDLDKAEAQYRAQLDSVPPGASDCHLSSVWQGLGAICNDRQDFTGALGYFQKILDDPASRNDLYLRAGSWGNMAVVYGQMGQLDKAMASIRRQIKIYENIDARESLQHSTGNLGVLYAVSGQFEKAEKQFIQQLEHSQRLGDQKGIAIALMNQGCVKRDTNDYDASRGYLDRAERLCRELGNEYILCNVLSEQAELAMKLRQSGRARSTNQQALKTAQRAGRNQIIRECLARQKMLDQ
jgi:tetratricopeptide (TPR) repeat protein